MTRYKVLDVFLLPKADRGVGTGGELIAKLCGWADVEGVTLLLSADSTVCDRKGSELDDAHLIEFYERHGFFLNDEHGSILTDTLISNKNIMQRDPVPVLSGHILKLSDL